MGHSVFISYRRKGGEGFAQMFYMLLGQRGYRVFYDIESLGQGLFDEKILHEIEEAEVFLVILSEGALGRCANDGDWVRREIAHAIKLGKPIVPILFRGFEFPAQMPEDIAKLARYNGVDFSDMQYFEPKMDALTQRIDEAAGVTTAKAVSAAATGADTEARTASPVAGRRAVHVPTASSVAGRRAVHVPTSSPQKSEPVFAYRGQPGLTDVIVLEVGGKVTYQAFAKCATLRSVVISDDVTDIEDEAFSLCAALTSVEIPAGMISIGINAFCGCAGLTEIRFRGTKRQWHAIIKGSLWKSHTGPFKVYCTDGVIGKLFA